VTYSYNDLLPPSSGQRSDSSTQKGETTGTSERRYTVPIYIAPPPHCQSLDACNGFTFYVSCIRFNFLWILQHTTLHMSLWFTH